MKRKPTILVVIPYGFNDRLMNFPEFTISRLLARNGWRVIGLVRQEEGEPAREGRYGIEIHRYGGAIAGVLEALSIIFAQRPDIVHVHTLRNNRAGVFAAMFARVFGIPLAFTEAGLLHDHYLSDNRDDPLSNPIHYERIPRSFSLRNFRSYFFHWPLTHADAAAFFTKHNIAIAHNIGLRNIRYIPPIVDAVRWDTRSGGGGIRERLPASYGLFVGQMKLRKGWDVLLRAIVRIPRDVVPAFVFVSSSAPRETDDFAAIVDSLGIRDRIIFLGTVASNHDLRVLFEKSTMAIVPSRYEGFGLVPLEAFEADTPIVASRVEALTDFLEHGKNAYLVPPRDATALARGIETLAKDAALQKRLSSGGAATLARMRSAEHAQAWLDFYDSLLRR